MLHSWQAVELDGTEYTVVVTHTAAPRAPVTVYINETNNDAMGDYGYTIGGASAVLHGEAPGSLGRLLETKLGRPVYVNVNGRAPDVVPVFRVVRDMVEATP